MMEWISVMKELPSLKKSAHFTFCNDEKIHENIWYDAHVKKWMEDQPMDFYGEYKGKVLYWMPLPEPPKDE